MLRKTFSISEVFINLSSIYHRMSEQYCYPLDNDQLIINIETGYDVDGDL